MNVTVVRNLYFEFDSMLKKTQVAMKISWFEYRPSIMVGNIHSILNTNWFANIHDDEFGCWNFKSNIEYYCWWGACGMIKHHLRSLIELTYSIESVDVNDVIACLYDKTSLRPF